MDGSTEKVRALPLIVEKGVFKDDPFVLIDAGCSGGIDTVWRKFGDHLVAFGFDPQQSECKRLQEREPNPRVKYIAAFVGLPETHPLVVQRRSEDQRIFQHFNPWNRLSTAEAQNLRTSAASAPLQSQPIFENLVTKSELIGIGDFVENQKVPSVDFIKIDVDGTDLDVVVSSKSIVKSRQVLGFAVEVNWTGSYLPSDNTFHNIDRELRSMGYSLVAVSDRTYSRRDLPAPFQYNMLAQTHGGQPIQGDAIYLRDAASELDGVIWGEALTPTKLLKLAGLYEIFLVPDLAAELLNVYREKLAPLIDVDALLNALTPRLNGRKMTYKEYLAEFRKDPTNLFPSRRTVAPTADDGWGGAGGQEFQLAAMDREIKQLKAELDKSQRELARLGATAKG